MPKTNYFDVTMEKLISHESEQNWWKLKNDVNIIKWY